MIELFLAPSLSNIGEDQLRTAPVQDETVSVINGEAAALIALETENTGVYDPEAQVMMRLYRGEPVEGALYEGLDKAVSVLDPAEALLSAVSRQMSDEEANDPANRYDTLYRVVDGNAMIARDLITFLGSDGLVKRWLSRNDIELTATEPYKTFTDDEIVCSIAQTLGLSTVGFLYELLYTQPDKYGLRPEIRSRRCHYALGKISATGVFEHIVTVLDETHPARQYS